jgi:thiol:disulfide interchange protein DsbD
MSIRKGILPGMIALAAAFAWGRPAEIAPLKVQLLSDTDSVQPGKPLWVALRFEMKKQWHIYWRNPGDSGEPPRVRWKLPPGFQAGDVQWPVPERLGSGSVIDYGYHGSVVLPVEIQTPATGLPAGGTLTLSAEVSWIVCKDMCMPGNADLTLTLPVRMAPGSPSASHARIQAGRSRLPRPMPPTWNAEATSDPASFVLTIRGARLGKASFFPFEAGQIDNAAPQVLTAIPGGVRLTLRKSEQLTQAPARLDGVLETGPGRACSVSIPLSRMIPGSE